jgi:HD-GYP domain-containing protein (c-di-GMP phosphodiesterase class II)
MPSTEAQRRLSAGAGTQFDAEVVMAFLNVLARSDADYQRGRSARTEAHLRESEPVVALAS